MSIKNQKEQLMHSMIGQLAIIGAVLAGTWLYTIPQYDILSNSVKGANDIISEFSQTTQTGIAREQLTALLKNDPTKSELLTIIEKAPTETSKALEKTSPSDTYLVWLNKELGKSDNDKEKLEIQKARLNSILPTLSPISNTIEEDTVSMKKYISFVEENIIKKFNLNSTSGLSIQNIKYGKKNAGVGEMPEVVGSFENEITFKAKNIDIMNMIQYINKLGSPEILLATGTVIAQAPKVMSNPFVMMDTLSLENNLDSDKPDSENAGRMTIRFYVRGSSINDILFLKNTIDSRQKLLAVEIKNTYNECVKNNCGKNKTILFALDRKITEFSKGTSLQKSTVGTEQVYSLAAQLDSIKSMEDELRKIKQ